MKNKLNIKKNCSVYGRRAASAVMCILLTMQPLGAVLAFDTSGGDDVEKYAENEIVNEYDDADIDVKYTDTVYKGADYSWYICAGTGAETYTISDAASLKALSNIVNGSDLPEDEMCVTIEDGTVRSMVISQTDFAGKTITLINDIDMSQLVNESDENEGSIGTISSWVPAGTENTPFAGIFNGSGKEIKNLKVTDESLAGGTAAGLFGYASGEIKDLNISGSISLSGDSVVDAGLVAGVLSGRAVNVSADADISVVNGNAGAVAGMIGGGGSVACARAAGAVRSADGAAGGIAGRGADDSSVADSYNTCDISGRSAAGIVTEGTTVSGCFNTGSVQGTQVSAPIGGTAQNCFALEGCVVSNDITADTQGVSFASSDSFKNCTVAWKLNTASGSQKNSELWTQGTEHPELASKTGTAPVYRLTMNVAAGIDLTAAYEGNNDGILNIIGSEKINANDEVTDGDTESDVNTINYYYIKGKTLRLTAKADVTDGDIEADKTTSAINLVYAVIKDCLGRTKFSSSTKSFASDGLVLTCSPDADSASGEILKYPDADNETDVQITFDANGGCFGGDADNKIDIASIAYGSFMSEVLYSEDDPVYSDGPAEFTGWYTDSTCRIPADANAILAGDMTLYAGWIKQCEVTFDLNGYDGDEDVSDWPLVIRMYTGSPADSQTPPVWTSTSNDNGTITRHNFLGWFTEPEGGEAWGFDMPVTESMILYAHWEHVETQKPDSSSGGVTSISGGESFQKLLGTIQDGMSYTGQTITFDEDIELDDAVVISSFDGILDGQGHTLKLNKKQFTSTGNMTALFRNLKKGAELRNINIVYDDGGDISSSAKFAVLCDTNHGTVKNCTLKFNIRKSGSAENFGGSFVRVNAADGVISGCTLRNGSSVSFNGSFGGIAGENRGQISSCVIEQNVKISASKSAGGIVFKLIGEKEESSSESDSAQTGDESDKASEGNMQNENDGTNTSTESSGPAAVRNCSVSGDISADISSKKNSEKYYAGGISAEMDAADGAVLIEKCFVNGGIKGKGAAGGITGVMRGTAAVGDAESDTDDVTANCNIESCYAAGNVMDAAAVGGIVGVIRGGAIKYCYSTSSLSGAEIALGGIAGKGGGIKISDLSDDEDEVGDSYIESCYWFGSSFSAYKDAEQGMFCGGESEDVTVKNCYFGASDDKPSCVTDTHLSNTDTSSAVRKSAEFADGTVAWALETFNGTQKEHLRRFSMNAKTTDDSGKASSSSSAGDGSNGDDYSFVRDTGNYLSPVLNSDSIYRAEVKYSESTDQDVKFDKSKDYVKITVGNTSIKAYADTSSSNNDSDASDDSAESGDKDKTEQNDGDSDNDNAAVYMYGSETLTWREYSNDMHNALVELVNKLIEEEMDDSYNILNTYNITISDTDGNVLDAYKASEFNRLGKTGSYKLGGYDMKIEADVFKTITRDQVIEEEEKKDDKTEPVKPSGGRNHSSSKNQSSGLNGDGVSGTNDEATGKTNGEDTIDSGAPAHPEQTVPVINSDSDKQISLVLPVITEQSASSDIETEQPDSEPEAAQESAPENPYEPQDDEKKQDEPEEQSEEQAQQQTVFEVIRKSVEENPVSMLAAGIIFVVIIAAAAINRMRRSR